MGKKTLEEFVDESAFYLINMDCELAQKWTARTYRQGRRLKYTRYNKYGTPIKKGDHV